MSKQEKVMKKESHRDIPHWKQPRKEIIGPAVRDWLAQASLEDKKKFCKKGRAMSDTMQVLICPKCNWSIREVGMVPDCPRCNSPLNLVTGTHQEIDEHFKDKDGKWDGTISWYRPCGREKFGFSSADHKSCWDCEWIVVAHQFNRMCVKNPKQHIWSGGAENEMLSSESKGTVADQCPEFQVAKELLDDRAKKMQTILACDICRRYLAHAMIEPLRCPGLSYDEPSGRKYVGTKGTGSFRWWDEIVKEHEEQHEKERLAFLETNKQHLQEHGLFGDLSGV